MVKGAVFHVKDPIVIGVTVKAGILKVGTPLCIPDKNVSLAVKYYSLEFQDRSY
jgi:translation initiation factor IF-2